MRRCVGYCRLLAKLLTYNFAAFLGWTLIDGKIYRYGWCKEGLEEVALSFGDGEKKRGCRTPTGGKIRQIRFGTAAGTDQLM